MEISEIKEKLTILEELNHYGLKTNRNPPAGGQAYMLCCPFHADKNPSM